MDFHRADTQVDETNGITDPASLLPGYRHQALPKRRSHDRHGVGCVWTGEKMGFDRQENQRGTGLDW